MIFLMLVEDESFLGFLRENIIEWVMVSIGITLILIGVAQHFHWLENKSGGVSIIRASNNPALSAGKRSKAAVVDIAGAVVKPGVYQMKDGSRINDLLIACGGLTRWANRRFIEKDLNRARPVNDGEKIYIPYIGEKETIAASSGNQADLNQSGSKVNINKATVGELENLPNIGFTYASAIVEYRQDKGPFSSIKDIENVPGIGEKTFRKIKDLITVD